MPTFELHGYESAALSPKMYHLHQRIVECLTGAPYLEDLVIMRQPTTVMTWDHKTTQFIRVWLAKGTEQYGVDIVERLEPLNVRIELCPMVEFQFRPKRTPQTA